jgi:glycosyltransferase involved in cell wall biosynthesis
MLDMNKKDLNIVFIGPIPFPTGTATTKRRRYMVDYMNKINIKCHVLITSLKYEQKEKNSHQGRYGLSDYFDLTQYSSKMKFFTFIKVGKQQLRNWYSSNKKNVLIFPTILTIPEWPLYLYARRLGYTIVFDQVETSYLLLEKNRFRRKLFLYISELMSHYAYKNSAGFMISKLLLKENEKNYPQRKLCLLQNSTPILNSHIKKTFNTPIYLLYSGTYAPKDGVDYLIDGVIRANEMGFSCNLILVGKGAPQHMTVLEKIKDKRYIDYRGFVSDEKLINIMLNSDILCVTRTNSTFANYGFPFKLSEYLATGNLVLATNVGDISDYIQNGKSAIIIPPENTAAIAEAIKYVIENPAESLKIALGGYEAMQKHFSIDVVGKKFIDFLKII